jgi:hypothetical protein
MKDGTEVLLQETVGEEAACAVTVRRIEQALRARGRRGDVA